MMSRSPRRTLPEGRPERAVAEHVKARWWRQHVAGMTREELGAAVGYTVSEIANFEAGVRRQTGAPPSAAAWRRYRLACAAVAAGLSAWSWE